MSDLSFLIDGYLLHQAHLHGPKKIKLFNTESSFLASVISDILNAFVFREAQFLKLHIHARSANYARNSCGLSRKRA